MYPCETKWLEQAMQDITNTQTVVVRPTLDILVMVDGGKLMSSLFVRDGVRALNGDIILKANY